VKPLLCHLKQNTRSIHSDHDLIGKQRAPYRRVRAEAKELQPRTYLGYEVSRFAKVMPRHRMAEDEQIEFAFLRHSL
jgi:hypothetical protein